MPDILRRIYAVIEDRQANPKTGSYTNALLDAGIQEVAKKVGEESVEVVLAAATQSDERLCEELADLAYHSLVLLAARGLTPDDVAVVLERRFGQ